MTIEEALTIIKTSKKTSHAAKAYASAWDRAISEYGEAAIKIQCLYILSNISHWREPQAKEIRALLKGMAK